MKIIPHFLPYPERILSRQERIIQRRGNTMDMKFAWYYALFLLVVFSAISIGSLFAYRSDLKVEEVQIPTEVVKQVSHEEIVGKKYTIRVGLDGARKIIPKISGLTVDERAKELLDTAWLAPTLPTWKKLGDKYKIDYTLAVAIAWSDSALWLALKSTHNLWNVGNRDDGSVVHFKTQEAWIEAIFATLAKWKYMQGHTIIGTLSGEGRKRLWLPWCAEEKDYRKKCYASSETHYSTNLVNIMSVLKNRQVTENDTFRL